MATATLSTWKPAQANDLRFGTDVRIVFHDGRHSFDGKVVRKWRGWDALLVEPNNRARVFRVCNGFSDWGTYDVFVRP